jgi:hypothetical protein
VEVLRWNWEQHLADQLRGGCLVFRAKREDRFRHSDRKSASSLYLPWGNFSRSPYRKGVIFPQRQLKGKFSAANDQHEPMTVNVRHGLLQVVLGNQAVIDY